MKQDPRSSDRHSSNPQTCRAIWLGVLSLCVLVLVVKGNVVWSQTEEDTLAHSQFYSVDHVSDYQPPQEDVKTSQDNVLKKVGKKIVDTGKKVVDKTKEGVKNVVQKLTNRGEFKPPVGLPDTTFQLTYTLAVATYRKNPDTYLANSGYPHIKKTGKCSNREAWQMCSYKDEKKKRLYIGFRGTNFIGNWLQDANRVFGGNQMDNVAKKYDADVDAMIKANPKYFPFLIVGHSAGGYFSDRVQRSRKIWRVTFNGFKAKLGDHYINVRTSEDIVSNAPYSQRNHYITVCSGGHGIANFEKCKTKTWTQLNPKLAALRVVKLPGEPASRKTSLERKSGLNIWERLQIV